MARNLPGVDERLDLRSLTARSVIASTLLGTRPPVLPTRILVAAAELFGVSASAARTALSRMASAGEVVAEGGSYRLTGALLHRQQRQEVGRAGRRFAWSGQWLLAIIAAGPRPAAHRAERRTELGRARLGELRDGVWVRPDNLGPLSMQRGGDLVLGLFEPDRPLPVEQLWDLDGWRDQALGLATEVAHLTPRLEAGDEPSLARGFVVSAAVLRLLQRDPLLPDELLPPGWPGESLRAGYDRFDTAYRSLLRSWFAAQAV